MERSVETTEQVVGGGPVLINVLFSFQACRTWNLLSKHLSWGHDSTGVKVHQINGPGGQRPNHGLENPDGSRREVVHQSDRGVSTLSNVEVGEIRRGGSMCRLLLFLWAY